MITTLTDAYLLDVQQGVHAPQDVYRIALYTPDASLGRDTEAYTTKGEVIGQAYGAGGLTLTGRIAQLIDGEATVTWANPVWPTATISARAALIYNYSKGNRALVVLDLGKLFVSTNGSFMVTLPANTIRISNG